MIVVICVLILLCIIIVILEDSIADNVDRPTPYLEHYHRKLNESNVPTIAKVDNSVPENSSITKSTVILPHISKQQPATSECWRTEAYRVVGKCSHCSKKEAHLPACLETGYKEHLHCQKSGEDVFRSCDTVTSLFWGFHFFMLCLSVVFNFYVRKRQSLLNRQILSKIEKQLSSGV